MTISTSKKLYLLVTIFIVGFLSLFLLNQFFLGLVNDLDKETSNHKVKIQISEYVTEDIFRVKSLFFELATTTTSKKSRRLVLNQISSVIEQMNDTLGVLEYGGTLSRNIKLNLNNNTDITKKLIYKVNSKENLALEVIEIRPKLIELKAMIVVVDALLEKRGKYKKEKRFKEFSKIAKKVRRFYKTTPAFFNRMSENIQRLLYESDIELEKLKQRIKDKKTQYMQIKMVLIAIVIILVMFIGMLISRIINKDHVKLLALNHQLEDKELAVKAILNGQENMVIVSDGTKMVDANDAIIKFFSQFDSVEDFKLKHDCICDFFIENQDDDLYVVKKDYYGDNWLMYILKHPSNDFKVKMNDGQEDHYFSITANKREINTDGDFIIIASLNDISAEVLSKKELKILNNNLESIISQKTDELQQLNINLEKKVKEELIKNRDKDKQMMQQSRSAALGEMIGNIAHQWRQPLSAISSTASGSQLHLQLGLSTNEEIDKSYEDIKGYVTFLTDTIEDFRNFFKDDKDEIEFNITDVVHKSLSIANAGFKDNNITVVENYKSNNLIVYGLSSELSQVFLNILNNAKDATIENNIENRIVHIRSEEDKDNCIIYLQDNAGGIPPHVIDKIFDPYFTTKHQAQGTGIGLFMSKEIVEKNMHGKITVSNNKVTLDDLAYNGACFKVSIPKRRA